ncbi:hypothetical protein CHN51_06555 [Sphingorhabdus sp. YGSMI21]|nr:hypothetical protein CHN51_06555 [Sphingorhabdus sp. YGSMI21]
MEIDLLMGGIKPTPDETRILQSVIAADMLFHLAIIAEQAVGERILGSPLNGSCPGLPRPNGFHRGKNESRFHRGGTYPLKAAKIAQNLIGE